jgi:hypothetical protein
MNWPTRSRFSTVVSKVACNSNAYSCPASARGADTKDSEPDRGRTKHHREGRACNASAMPAPLCSAQGRPRASKST